jgi:hypothetical protein
MLIKLIINLSTFYQLFDQLFLLIETSGHCSAFSFCRGGNLTLSSIYVEASSPPLGASVEAASSRFGS